MGELAEAEARYPAPWKGATSEEDLAYSQNVELANTEFEREVTQHAGPSVTGIDADKASMLNTEGWNLHGFYVEEKYDTDEEYAASQDKYYKVVMDDANAVLEADRVYAVGPDNARPALWAHEFQHRAEVRADPDLQSTNAAERAVRLFGGYRASTPEQWYDSVSLWKDQVKASSMKSAEESLKHSISMDRTEFIDREVAALKEEGNRPKDRTSFGFMDSSSHKSDIREQFDRREKSWDIEKSIQHKQAEIEEVKATADAKEMARLLKELDGRIEELDKALQKRKEKSKQE